MSGPLEGPQCILCVVYNLHTCKCLCNSHAQAGVDVSVRRSLGSRLKVKLLQINPNLHVFSPSLFCSCLRFASQIHEEPRGTTKQQSQQLQQSETIADIHLAQLLLSAFTSDNCRLPTVGRRLCRRHPPSSMACFSALVLLAAFLLTAQSASVLPRGLALSNPHPPADVFAFRQGFSIAGRQDDEDPAPLGMPLGDPPTAPEDGDADVKQKDDDTADSGDGTKTIAADGDAGSTDPASGDSDSMDSAPGDQAPDVDDTSADGVGGREGADDADDTATEKDGSETGDAVPGDGSADEAKPEDGATTDGSGAEGETGTTSDGGVDAGHTIPAGNVTEAFHAFTINQVVEVDDEEGFKMVPIFQNGTLVGVFESNPMSSDLSTLAEDVDDATWYNDGPYADRISFQYTYSPDVSDYTLSKPVIAVDTDMGVNPTLQDERNNPADGVGSFTVKYQCKPGGVEKSYVSLHIQVTKEHSVDATWVKVCGHGRNEHLNFGFIGGDDKVTLFNADGTYGTEEQHTLEVGPLQLSTALSAELTPPAWQMDFLDPHVESDSSLVTVSLRETIKAGTLNSDGPTKFSVLYYCAETTAKANIRFTLGIPPWDNVTASWRKTCGGTHSEALLIGTSGSGSFEVMQDGELSAKYNVTENTSVEQAYGKVEEIEGSMSSVKYYITNSDDTSEIHIQTIATTMSNPDVVSTIVEVPFTGSGSYLGPSGGTIPRQETKSLKLHFACKKVGESLVLVTLPTLKYKNVEFGFLKHCLAPAVRHHSGFLQTAGSIMGTILVLAVVGGIALWVQMRRRAQGAKYAPVATTDRVP